MDEAGAATNSTSTGEPGTPRGDARVLGIDEAVRLIRLLEPYQVAFKEASDVGIVQALLGAIIPSHLREFLTITTGDDSDLLLMENGLDLAIKVRDLLAYHRVYELLTLGAAVGIINGN
jgi:hypothetical protein